MFFDFFSIILLIISYFKILNTLYILYALLIFNFIRGYIYPSKIPYIKENIQTYYDKNDIIWWEYKTFRLKKARFWWFQLLKKSLSTFYLGIPYPVILGFSYFKQFSRNTFYLIVLIFFVSEISYLLGAYFGCTRYVAIDKND